MDNSLTEPNDAGNEFLRKLSREEELDLIFAEEYSCDPEFVNAVFEISLSIKEEITVDDVVIQPKLLAGGYGDILVRAKGEKEQYALLIEHKISAGPALRQAERYRQQAEHMRSNGVRVATVLVAPRSYLGEAKDYDLRIDLEDMADLLNNTDVSRLSYRRSRIFAAIEKKNTSGVQMHDDGVFELHKKYMGIAKPFCDATGIPLAFPPLKSKYYDGDSWIHRIRHPMSPDGVLLRHRLWISVGHNYGQIDLVVVRADEEQKSRFINERPDDTSFSTYSNAGVQVSFRLPALKPHGEFSAEVVKLACNRMSELVGWYAK